MEIHKLIKHIQNMSNQGSASCITNLLICKVYSPVGSHPSHETMFEDRFNCFVNKDLNLLSWIFSMKIRFP